MTHERPTGSSKRREIARLTQLRPAVAQLFAAAGESRADAVFGHARGEADLLVAAAFEMKQPHDAGLVAVEMLQQAFDLVAIGDALFVSTVHFRFADAGKRKSAERFLLQHFADDDSPSDDGQVGRQAAFATEVPQHAEIVFQKGEKDVGAKVFAILRGELNASRLRRVVDDVRDETEIEVDEIFPSPRFAGQAAIEKIAVEIGKGQGAQSFGSWRGRGDRSEPLRTELPIRVVGEHRQGFILFGLKCRYKSAYIAFSVSDGRR